MVTKAESKMHKKATDLVHSDKALNWDDKMFIIDNYYPLQENGRYSNAFFTPYMLARDFIVMNFYRTSKKPVLDLCAGIGVLSLAAVEFDKVPEEEIVCIELNRSFLEVGKRLLPKATWIEGDIFEETKAFSDKHFSTIMSNPPFGRFSKIRPLDKNNFGEFEYEAIHLGKRIADIGIFIIPQMSAPTHPGNRGRNQPEPRKYNKFFEKAGIALEIEGSVDCEGYRNDWKGTVINVELVNTVYE